MQNLFYKIESFEPAICCWKAHKPLFSKFEEAKKYAVSKNISKYRIVSYDGKNFNIENQ